MHSMRKQYKWKEQLTLKGAVVCSDRRGQLSKDKHDELTTLEQENKCLNKKVERLKMLRRIYASQVLCKNLIYSRSLS